jgi:hypothetical protein
LFLNPLVDRAGPHIEHLRLPGRHEAVGSLTPLEFVQ